MTNKEIIKREKEIEIQSCKLGLKRLLLELDKLKEDNKEEVRDYYG